MRTLLLISNIRESYHSFRNRSVNFSIETWLIVIYLSYNKIYLCLFSTSLDQLKLKLDSSKSAKLSSCSQQKIKDKNENKKYAQEKNSSMSTPSVSGCDSSEEDEKRIDNISPEIKKKKNNDKVKKVETVEKIIKKS